jgi:hypothetical protein
MGDVAAPELSPRGSRARSYGTRGSVGAHFGMEVRSGADGHVVTSELSSAMRRGLGPWDTWQRQSPPL